MKLASFLTGSGPPWGAVLDRDRWLDLPAAWRLIGQEPLIVPVDDRRDATRAIP